MAAKTRTVHYWQLEVFQLAREVAQSFLVVSRLCPKEERFSLTDQGRRASRAISALISKAWRRRKYEAAFVNELHEAEGEAAEPQVWVMHAVGCPYLTKVDGLELHRLCGEPRQLGVPEPRGSIQAHLPTVSRSRVHPATATRVQPYQA